jgi:hypothetical protein
VELLTGSTNSILVDNCEALQDVTVKLAVTDDLVTAGNDGFSLQLNAYPMPGAVSVGLALNWIQFVLRVANGEATFQWQAWALGATAFPPGYQVPPGTTNPNQPVPPFQQPNAHITNVPSNQLPKGSNLTIALTTNTQGAITAATFKVQLPGAEAQPVIVNFPSDNPDAQFAIGGFQVDLVGVGNDSRSTFTSGAGELTYSVSPGRLSVQDGGVGAGCGQYPGAVTGETSNAVYGPVTPASGSTVSQSVAMASKVVASQTLPGGEVFFLANDGTLMYALDGTKPSTPVVVDKTATAFQALGADQVYVLGSDGNLWLEQGPWSAMTRVQVDSNVAAFQAIDANEAYVLGTDGNLWDETGPWTSMTREHVDGNVKAFQAFPDSRAYVLGTDGNLWDETGPWTGMTREHVDGNVKAFQALQVLVDGPQAYVLGDNGNLWLEQGPWSNMTREQVDGHVQAFQALNASSAYVLGDNGNLWLESGPWTSMTRKQVDGNVTAFEALNAVQAYVIGSDGKLWNESGPWAKVPPTRHEIGGGIYP